MYAVLSMRLYGRVCVCGYMRNLDEPRSQHTYVCVYVLVVLLIKLPTLRDCRLL